MRICLLAGVFLAVMQSAWAVSSGATRDQVIAELGKPTSSAKTGDHEILLFPKGVRVEFEAGRIVSARGIALTDPAPAVAAEPTVPKKAPATQPPAAKPSAKKDDEEPEIAAKPERPTFDKNQAGLEKTFDALVAQQEKQKHAPLQPKFDVVSFLLGLVLNFAMTLGALKLACKYWGAEVFWSGIVIVTSVDTVIRAVMTTAGELLLGFPSLFYADDAVGGIVMVLLLKKLSINQSTAQAVQLTLTSKTFTVVVGSFLVTAALRLLR